MQKITASEKNIKLAMKTTNKKVPKIPASAIQCFLHCVWPLRMSFLAAEGEPHKGFPLRMGMPQLAGVRNAFYFHELLAGCWLNNIFYHRVISENCSWKKQGSPC